MVARWTTGCICQLRWKRPDLECLDNQAGHNIQTAATQDFGQPHVNSVAWSPTGREIAAASDNKIVEIWNVMTTNSSRIANTLPVCIPSHGLLTVRKSHQRVGTKRMCGMPGTEKQLPRIVVHLKTRFKMSPGRPIVSI